MVKAKSAKKGQNEGDGDGEASSNNINVRLALERARANWIAEDCYKCAINTPHQPSYQMTNSLTKLAIIRPLESARSYLDRIRGADLSKCYLRMSKANIESLPPLCASKQPLSDIENTLVDVCLNAGGPVWTTALRPSFQDTPLCTVDGSDLIALDQYLAVGVSQIGISSVIDACAEPQHLLGVPVKSDSLLQIWRLHGNYSATRKLPVSVTKTAPPAKKKSDDPNYVPKPKGRPRKYPRPDEGPKDADEPAPAPAPPPPVPVPEPVVVDPPAEPEVQEAPRFCDVQAELVYCVSLEGRGAAWSALWGPATAPEDNSLGLVALVVGDGSCVILQLPKEVSAPSSSGASSSGSIGGLDCIPVLSEGSIARWEVNMPGLLVQCVAWNKRKPGQFSCGMSDGSITVWDLNKQSTTGSSGQGGDPSAQLTTPIYHLVDTQHLEPQIASLGAARCIQYCPYDANLLLLGTQDDIKIWNLKEPDAPVYSKKAPTAVSALSWDPHGFGFYSADGESTAIAWTPLWGSSFKPMHRKDLYAHSLLYGGTWGLDASSNDDQSFLLSAASDGSVRGGYASAMTYTKARNTCTLELFRVRSVQWEDDVLSIVADSKVTALANGTGAETFVTNNMLSMQCIDSVEFNAPSHATNNTSTTGATAAASAGASKGASQAAPKTKTKTKKRKNVIESDSDSCGGDSDGEVLSVPKGGAGSAGNAGNAGNAAELASMRLVAYGAATGLVRIHSIDPMRTFLGGGK